MGTGASPNNLLDQRDQLVSELNQIVGVESVFRMVALTLYRWPMATHWFREYGAVTCGSFLPAPTLLVRLSLMLMGRRAILDPEKLLNTGSLGGILTFRSQDLDQTRNAWRTTGAGICRAFNTQHKAGFDAVTAMPVKISLLSVSPRFCKTRKTKVTLRSVQRATVHLRGTGDELQNLVR